MNTVLLGFTDTSERVWQVNEASMALPTDRGKLIDPRRVTVTYERWSGLDRRPPGSWQATQVRVEGPAYRKNGALGSGWHRQTMQRSNITGRLDAPSWVWQLIKQGTPE